MGVKVCDFKSETFEKDFINSIFETGFAVITNHGVSHELIKNVQVTWKQFFLSPQEEKNALIGSDGNLGYHGFKKEQAVGAKVPDLKEFFHLTLTSPVPNGTAGYTKELFIQLEAIGLSVLEILDRQHPHRTISYRDVCEFTDNTILRTLYYPALDFELEKGAVRSAAHEDINFITLLVAATSPGLQVKDSSGNWIEVPHEENSIVCNIGDMLQLASGGVYRSTTHRVVNPSDSSSDRISMPLFIHPLSTTELVPGITAKQYLDERIAQIYGDRK